MPYFVYILRFSDNSLYIGQTNNIERRIEEHKSKTTKTAKFAKDHGAFVLAYQESHLSRTEAMQRERQLKGWRREKKEALISGNIEKLKLL